MPRSIGAVVSSKMATLHECNTVYSLQDVYDLLEISTIDAYNQKLVADSVKRD